MDPEYLHGLRMAVSASLEYACATIEGEEDRPPMLPVELLGQARLAARNGVSLDTVLRRYFSGFTLFGHFVLQECESRFAGDSALPQRLFRTQARQFDLLVAAVTEEYEREAKARPSSTRERQVDLVRRLLRCESLDVSGLSYDFDAWHLAVVVLGLDRGIELRRLARELDRRLLVVAPEPGTTWAWFGGRRPLPSESVVEQARGIWPESSLLAIGQPGRGMPGWRISHCQARTLVPLRSRLPESILCYADVGLLASVLKDELLVDSLHQLYIEPLSAERDGGEVLRETLATYFRSQRNITSTAAALGVSRQTVRARLQTVEARLGRSVDSSSAAMEIALKVGGDDQASGGEVPGKGFAISAR
jgi:hypothetical protein